MTAGRVRWSAAAAAVVVAVAGCSDEQLVGKVAGLSGVYDTVVVGERAFVTSADKDELRVLDLTGDPTRQVADWVRAPNPIEPLAVPVSVDSPVGLARDVSYQRPAVLRDRNGSVRVRLEAGDEVTGPYVYVRGTGRGDISVVNADEPTEPEAAAGSRPQALKEWLVLPTGGTVTAMVGHGPTAYAACVPAEEGHPREGRTASILYYAVTLAQGAELRAQEIPAPCELAPEFPAGTPHTDRLATRLAQVAAPRVLLTDPESIITALALLPDGQVAVARRGRTGVGSSVVLLDPVTGLQREMRFPAAVRLLASHAAPVLKEGDLALDQPRGPDGTPQPIGPGRYLFGVLDETSCGGQDACRGVLAVDTLTGDVAVDYTGRTMLPFRTGSALPTGLSVTALRVRDELTNTASASPFALRAGGITQRAAVPTQDDTIGTALFTSPALVALVPASDGLFTIFDAARLVSFDNNGSPPRLSEVRAAGSADPEPTKIDWLNSLRTANGRQGRPSSVTSVVDHLEPGYSVSGWRDGPPASRNQAVGTSFNETITLGYEPALLSTVDTSRRRDPARPQEYDVTAEAFAQVAVGDAVFLYGIGGTAEAPTRVECTGTVGLPVVRKEALPGPVYRLFTAAPPPAECEASLEGHPYYYVRALADGPDSGNFVVTGGVSGYLGRYGSQNRRFVYQGAERYRASVPGSLPVSADRGTPAPVPPALEFTYSGNLDPNLQRDYYFELRADTNYAPFEFTLNTQGSTFFSYRVPGAASFSYLRNSYVVTYPSADAIVRLKRDEVRFGLAIDTGAYPHF